MNLSPEAEDILEQMQTLREERREKLERDLHYIDAAYDRNIRRVQTSAIWNRSSCRCFTHRPFSLRRFCSRRVRWLRRRLAKN